MRNRSIRSVLARRPMFANGGMLPPVTQSPLASGILGSSSPLIETVNNQQSPDRGVRVSMANGGVATFQNGGFNKYPSRPQSPGYTPQNLPSKGALTPVINTYPSRPRSPEWSPPNLRTIGVKEHLFGKDKVIAETLEAVVPGLDTTGLSRAQIRALAVKYGIIGEAFEEGEIAPAEAPDTGTGREIKPEHSFGLGRTVPTAMQPRVPEVATPDTDGKFAGIGQIFNLGAPRETAIRPRVSEILDETKAPPEKVGTFMPDLRKPPPRPPDISKFLGTPEGSEIDASQVPDATSALDIYMQTGVNPADMTMDEVKKFHASLPDAPEGVYGTKDILGRLIANDEQKIADAQQQDGAPVVGQGPDTSGQADMLATEGIDTSILSEAPTDLPSLEQISAELQGKEPKPAATVDETPVVAEDGAEEVVSKDGADVEAEAAPEVVTEDGGKANILAGKEPKPAATVVTETFAKQNPRGAPVRTKEEYIQEFKDALPEYKGMSEEEKGFTIMEAGLKVMAGQSANALENIAGGLKGISKEFIADKKARRAYDQQINLSAAKYGLESVAKDRTAALALAKEGRIRPFELIAKEDFVMDGQTIKKGTAVPLTNDQITAGYLTKFPLTYRETFVSDAKAAAALAKKRLDSLQKPQGFSSDRKEYVNNARSIKNGVRMKGLLMDAAKIAIPQGTDGSKILGIKPLFSSWVNKGLNAAGYQVDTPDGRSKLNTFRSTAPEEYKTLMHTIGTTMVTEILNESNKTISEGDRARVDDLVTAYSDYDGTVASYRSLLTKLKNLEQTIDAGINTASGSMRGIEKQWGGVEFHGGARGSDILSTITATLGTPSSYSVDGRSSVAVPYTDIIDMKTRKFTPKYQNIFNKRKP